MKRKKTLPQEIRVNVLARDDCRCAICGTPNGAEIHHIIPRGQGGKDYYANLITLCWRCHKVAHGTRMPGWVYETPEDVEQAIAEYMGDWYAENDGEPWFPWLPDERDGILYRMVSDAEDEVRRMLH